MEEYTSEVGKYGIYICTHNLFLINKTAAPEKFS